MSYEKAKQLIPSGTQLLSKRPEMYAPVVFPYAYDRTGKGIEIYIDGKKYYDFSTMGIGTCPLGYHNKAVDKAVIKEIRRGSMSSLNSKLEVKLAELLCRSGQMVRFQKTGGEAMAVAIRIARAYTGQDKVAFNGYHGWHDWYLSANIDNPNALDNHLRSFLEISGVPKKLKGTAIPFKDKLESGKYPIIVVEPIRYEMPDYEFVKFLRKESKKALIISDEITSGFRYTDGGIFEAIYGFRPDISVYAKAMGNGYPIAAVVGKSEVMQAAQDTFISSTYWTESIGFAAAIATIKEIRKNSVFRRICAIGAYMKSLFNESCDKHNLKMEMIGHSALQHIVFDYGEDNSKCKTAFITLMLEQGIIATDAFYPTIAHKGKLHLYTNALEKVLPRLSRIMSGEEKFEGELCHTKVVKF